MTSNDAMLETDRKVIRELIRTYGFRQFLEAATLEYRVGTIEFGRESAKDALPCDWNDIVRNIDE